MLLEFEELSSLEQLVKVAIVNPVTINANIEKRFMYGNDNKNSQDAFKAFTPKKVKNITLYPLDAH